MTSLLITGGTGSFGRNFAKHALSYGNIERIVIYSRDEHKQEQMARELKDIDVDGRLRFFIGDVRDKERLKLAANGCWHVLHTAALKIVPTGEYNPQEVIKTNILGTQNLIDVCLDLSHRDRKVIGLSTDKAVAPINLYGATKLCAEKLLLASNNLAGDRQASFSVVRYGNVANSNGSVIKLFMEQKAQGKPLTITHPEMTRYWITLDEACKYVAQCFGVMQGGEIFIPTMRSFNVIDLAKAILDTDNLQDKIQVIGVRPGEKINEQIDADKWSHKNEHWMNVDELRKEIGAL